MLKSQEKNTKFLSYTEDDDRLNEIQNMAVEASQKKRTKSVAEKSRAEFLSTLLTLLL